MCYFTDEKSKKTKMLSTREKWNIQASDIARNTHNPIRSIVENIVVEPNPNKKLIALSIGKFFKTFYFRDNSNDKFSSLI